MGIFSWVSDDCTTTSVNNDSTTINPTTGLPMTGGGIGGFDIGGNTFGSSDSPSNFNSHFDHFNNS